MHGDDVLAILAGKVIAVTVDSFTVEPGTRVELPSGYEGRVSVGALVLVRARRVRDR